MPSPAKEERWIVLTYKVPREPTANRVYVWRKVKQLGAIALQDAAWVLPVTPKTQEHFQWLAAEISELGGEARLWNSALQLEISEEPLRKQFEDQVDSEYKEILLLLKRKNRDVAALSRRYQRKRQGFLFVRVREYCSPKALGSRGEGNMKWVTWENWSIK